jgi:hypothetical protein
MTLGDAAAARAAYRVVQGVPAPGRARSGPKWPSATEPGRLRLACSRCGGRRVLSVRDLPYLRDPAVILIDQLKQVYIDGQLETIDTTNWFPRVMRKDYIVALTGAGSGPDPDQNLHLLYGCGAELNYNGYCSPEVDKLIDRQSSETDQEKRKQRDRQPRSSLRPSVLAQGMVRQER